MEAVFCPEENAFPDVRGLNGPFTCLNSARYGTAWGALGAAEDWWFRARDYVMDRWVEGLVREYFSPDESSERLDCRPFRRPPPCLRFAGSRLDWAAIKRMVK